MGSTALEVKGEATTHQSTNSMTLLCKDPTVTNACSSRTSTVRVGKLVLPFQLRANDFQKNL